MRDLRQEDVAALKALYEVLSTMTEGRGAAPWERAARLYSTVCVGLPCRVLTAAAESVPAVFERRPEPAALARHMLEAEGLMPTVGESWIDLWGNVERGARVPEFRFGATRIAMEAMVGSWEQLRELRPHLAEGDIRAIWLPRFARAFDGAAGKIVGEMLAELRRGAA